MASTLNGPNPLRPYYNPPSIGLPTQSDAPDNASSAVAASSSSARMNLGSSARDLLPDFDYDYLAESSPSILDGVKDLLDRALWRYSSVLMAQPFDAAKTILQVYVPPDEDFNAEAEFIARGGRGRFPEEEEDEDEFDDEEHSDSEDERSLFTSSQQDPRSPSSARHRRPPPRTTNRRGYVTPIPTSKNTVLLKEPFSILETLGAVWSRHGATSVWKGTNATFIYSVLFPTLNTYLRGLLSAILALPDETVSSLAEPDLLLSSSASGTTLVLTCIASALSAIILSPIDTTRTYLMLTQGSHGPRTLIRAIKKLPSPYYLIPSHLLPITLLTSTLPNLIAGSAPLFFRNYLSLDPLTNQSAWSIFAFISSGLELAVRFPLETVLRRAQIATYTSPALRRQDHSPPARPTNLAATGSVRSGRASAVSTTQPVETVVPTPQSYRGVVGTMWSIVYEEGTSAVPRTIPVRDLRDSLDDRHSDTRSERSMRTQQRRRRGQGIQGLYRGWRLGMWSIVGVWGSGFLGAILGSDSEGMVSNSGGRF